MGGWEHIWVAFTTEQSSLLIEGTSMYTSLMVPMYWWINLMKTVQYWCSAVMKRLIPTCLFTSMMHLARDMTKYLLWQLIQMCWCWQLHSMLNFVDGMWSGGWFKILSSPQDNCFPWSIKVKSASTMPLHWKGGTLFPLSNTRGRKQHGRPELTQPMPILTRRKHVICQTL